MSPRLKKSLANAGEKLLETLTSKKFQTLVLSSVFLYQEVISDTIWVAIALGFMGVTGAIDHKKTKPFPKVGLHPKFQSGSPEDIHLP